MNRLFIASFLFLSACGKFESTPSRIIGINPEFVPYIGLYTYHKGRAPDYEIHMGFANLSGDNIGLCMRWTDGYRQILIDKEYWDNSNESLRVSLVFHELGHCDLNREHSSDPNSIMYEYNIGSFNWYELFYPTTIDYRAFNDSKTIPD